jgi:hypothetical protein
VLRDVLVGPVELPSETPVAVLDEEERWFGAGGLGRSATIK